MRSLIFTSLLFITAATACENPDEKTKSSYLCTTGEPDKKRLDEMNEAYPNEVLLSKLDSLLPENPVIKTYGCGPGEQERKMARRWPKSDITGSDKSPDHIKLAKELSTESNIKFIVQDANAIDDKNKCDLIHARFLFLHLQEPKVVLEKMKEALKNSGYIAIEDFSVSSSYYQPENPFFNKTLQLTKKIGEAVKVDYYMGEHIAQMMQDLGLEIVINENHTPDRSNEMVKNLWAKSILAAKELILQKGLYEDKELSLDDLLKGMNEFAAQEDSRISMSDHYWVVGKKL